MSVLLVLATAVRVGSPVAVIRERADLERARAAVDRLSAVLILEALNTSVGALRCRLGVPNLTHAKRTQPTPQAQWTI